MGTGPFAIPTLKELHESNHEVPAVITRPDRQGPSRKKQPAAPMRDAAAELNIPRHAPEDINSEEGVALLASLKPDLLMVCDYGQILSKEALSTAPMGGINLHGSLLPKYRGAAPVHWAVYNGDPETGISVIHMTTRLDGGPILTERRTPIEPNETTETLEPRLAILGAAAVLEAIEMLAKWDGESVIGNIQDAKQTTKAPKGQHPC
ncbi:MAG: methionyl-tRNA formyltransferase [bacterium]|nr:methionyl-tRNA formyltransferase [bacterium]